MNLRSCQFAGVHVLDVDMSDAVRLVYETATRREPIGVHLCNAHTLTLAGQDADYARLLGHKSLNFADGVPVAWFARMRNGRPRRGPVRGPTLMRRVMEEPGLRHFLLGGTDEVIELLLRSTSGLGRNVNVVGAIAPDFGAVTDEDLERWASAIGTSGAQIVWVGLGTPKQDEVIAALVDRVDVVLIGVGAAFDFLSGTKREAPAFLHGSGFEWIFRLVTEPHRLWRRYLVGNLRFVRYALREGLRQGR